MKLRNIFRNCYGGLPGIVLVCLFATLSLSLIAQTAGTCVLTGRVSSASGGVVGNATVTATRVDTGQARSAAIGTDGTYKFELLAPGDYRVKFEAAGFKTLEIASTTVRGGEPTVVDVKLYAGEPISGKATPVQQDNLPNAPSSNTAAPSAPSLEDLGLSPEQTQGSAQEQARLDKRTHMLKVHQRLGLITIAPLAATFIASAGAGGKDSNSTDRTVHAALGAVSTGLYLTTAYYAIRAPKISGTENRGPIRLHKALAWIHGPGMVLTPILGALAYDQKSRGEKVHGIASAHGAVAVVTGLAFGASVLSVSLKF